MCKKLAMLGILGALGAITVVGTGAWSYVRTSLHSAHDSVRNSVPIEWEIKRAHQMIDDLEPEITNNLLVVTREEIGVTRLAEEIESKEAQLAKGRDEIMRLKGDLQKGGVRFVYAKRSYTEAEVRDDLANRFKRFQVHEKTTQKLTQILSAREKNLDAARLKLEGMLSAKRELEVEIENLQARLTMVEVAKTTSPVSIDDSQLSSTRKLLDDIRTRIDVEEQLVSYEGALSGAIRFDESTSPELLTEIADYFGEGRAEVESLVRSGE